MQSDPDALNSIRPRMMSVAYRMLGSVTEAEDVVQEAFLRLHAAKNVVSIDGFLIRVTTRLAIDRLRVARRQEYLGPWVPEPVDTRNGASNLALAESLTQAFLLMLERLSPDERAAFLLRTVFDYDYSEIAEVLDKSATHVRQIVSRARQRLGNDQPRFRAPPAAANQLAMQFVAACRSGDVKQIEHFLTEDVAIHSDGGGKATAARVVIHGRERATRFIAGVFRKRLRLGEIEMQMTTVNGEPGIVFRWNGKVMQVVSFQIENQIRTIYMTLNPDKLARWSAIAID